MAASQTTLTVQIAEGIATITLNRPATLNAITAADYDALANMLREIDQMDDVFVTVWQANGTWFCAGTDISDRSPSESPDMASNTVAGNVRNALRKYVVGSTLDVGKAMYSHRKILVAALNGPVMGISAAFLGYFDFIYALPTVWLAVPFSFLGRLPRDRILSSSAVLSVAGLVAEGGASVTFVNRMGLSIANEVLIFGKRKSAEELLDCGFINKIFPTQSVESFHHSVHSHLVSELSGLDTTAMLGIRKLIRQGLNEQNDMDAVNLRESYAQAERFASGLPSERFRKVATKEIKHKL